MCECLKLIGDKLKHRLMENIPEGSEVHEGFDTGWENTCLSFSTGTLIVMMKYKLAYRAKKKDGTPAKNLTRLETNLKMSYCPICGEKQE
ncbi:hypothetical protein [Symbiopectobacterium purcellii]|uniref:Uncharacterized protein n=1 Tax=Symbiopectobacterium purcellii TaxID=2871826 RepID=A0ABX9ASY1_9ENTR|nr:hypothetical protein [Symbiopectobacterium purcellii]QZN97818.1 hypothetical protein K6K13_11240 [Symbiopectobacterium purcellii]